MSSVKKFSILLVSLLCFNGCITIVFEPSMGEGQGLTNRDSGQEDPTSHAGKEQKQ
jgi:hypothetical protein